MLKGLHIGILDDHVEAVITYGDVDDNWQLIDVTATLNPTKAQLARFDAQLTEALEDTQCR